MSPPHAVAGATHILWRRTDQPGHEWCAVRRSLEGVRIEGVAVGSLGAVPYRVDYAIELAADGTTRRLRLTSFHKAEIRLDLEADGAGRWRRDGVETPVVDAPDEPPAVDLDLGFSPVTNSLPIWRLGASLRPGESRDIRVAWVLFPSLEVVLGRQTYTFLGDRRWQYRSKGFEAELRVGDDGLVEWYPDGWEAVARETAATA